jgi:hypothetical protein
MGFGGVVRRRLFGLVVLGTAVLLLVLGLTVLRTSLQGVYYLLYWLVCMALTAVAVGVALADARATRTELRKLNRELIEQTVKEIQEEAKARNQRPGDRN